MSAKKMKWAIKFFESSIDARFTDDYPLVNFAREGINKCWRLSTPIGFLDFIETNDKLYLNNSFLTSVVGLDTLSFKLTLDSIGNFHAIASKHNVASGKLKPQPTIDREYLEVLDEMYKLKLVPYPKIPDEPGKSIEEIKALGKQFFPHRPENFLLALAIYDWTTADFDRMALLTEFSYTAIENRPLDIESLTDAIWTSNWPPYTPQDLYFMASFLMKPAKSREQVFNQLKKVASRLFKYAQAETRVMATALSCMPPTSVFQKPKLYSGQVDIGNLGTSHFAPGFFEFPLNKTEGAALEMDLRKALHTFMKKGEAITSKKIISFTDTIDDAMHYQNGILLITEPDNNDLVWSSASYVTPLSDGPAKTEYTFAAGSKFLIKNIEQQIIHDKPMIVITLLSIGCLDPDLVASNQAIPIEGTKLTPEVKQSESVFLLLFT